jgi:hypothetical protein
MSDNSVAQMQKTQRTELEKALHSREVLINRAFYFVFEIIAAFLGPALFVAFMFRNTVAEKWQLYVLLGFAFLISWAYVIWRYRTFAKRLFAQDAKIKSLEHALEEASDVQDDVDSE